MLKTYLRVTNWDHDDQLVRISLNLARIRLALVVAHKFDFSGVCLPVTGYEVVPWEKTPPTDGFVSQRDLDAIASGDFTTTASQNISGSASVHVDRDGTFMLEIEGGWTSVWVDLEEATQWGS